MCGENAPAGGESPGDAGSSPRVRGKLQGGPVPGHAGGLIPACAGKTASSPRIARPRRAHPRVCGENIFKWHRRSRRTGSSPRVRGKREQVPWPVPREGLIPACAGKTRTRPHSPGRAGAHPRVCGENLPGDQPPRPALGSSPRVRGKRGLQRRPRGFAGLIPACAGKTPMQALALARFSAHPRVCGENPAVPASSATHRGSSPRVRGKPTCRGCPGRPPRLIPARAGKTRAGSASPGASRAHPRACGENENVAGHDDAFQGSSPRVRGKQRVSCCVPSSCGLIPARAGKTPHGVGVGVERRAHPRACGENVRRALGKRGQWGSSPRVRGKLGVLGGEAEERGLIPACAGKTTSPTPCGSTGRAHPRVCGENLLASALAAWWLGSSPRVRGKRQELEAVDEQPRLIPACAGKTGSWPVRPPRRPAHPRVCGENEYLLMLTSSHGGSSPRVRGKPPLTPSTGSGRGLIPACAGKTPTDPFYGEWSRAHPRVCGENPA